ncbi:hypothetical protein Tco_0852986, partial [Tanacetum coccineum]
TNLKESKKEKTNENIDNGLASSLAQEKNELFDCICRPRDRDPITRSGIKNGDQAIDAEGMEMEIDLSNLETMNTMFSTLFRES